MHWSKYIPYSFGYFLIKPFDLNILSEVVYIYSMEFSSFTVNAINFKFKKVILYESLFGQYWDT